MPPHNDGSMMPALRLFENISGNIVLMAILHLNMAHVEPGLCQCLARLLQDMALGFPFLPNPAFLLIAQLLAQSASVAGFSDPPCSSNSRGMGLST